MNSERKKGVGKGWRRDGGWRKEVPSWGFGRAFPVSSGLNPCFELRSSRHDPRARYEKRGRGRGLRCENRERKREWGRGVDWRSEVPFTSFASSSSLSTSLSVYAREERRKKGLSISCSSSCSLFQLLLQRRLTDCAVNLFVGSKHSPSLAHGSITPVILFREENRTVSFRESRY